MKFGASYFGNRMVNYVKMDMKRLKEEGFDYVVHTFSENDYLFYKDTMKEIVSVSKEVGLEVWIDPWGVGRIFGGEAFSIFAGNNIEECQVLSDNKPIGIACPNSPKFRAFMKEWIATANDTGADCFFWDEPHFYIASWLGGRKGTWGCTCKYCREKFTQETGEKFPSNPSQKLTDMKDKWIKEFLTELINVVKQKGKKNIICIFPSKNNEGVMDWDRVAGIEGLDNFGTDPYWFQLDVNYKEFATECAQKTIDVCKKYGIDSHLWLQGFKVPKGREVELADAVEIYTSLGVRNIAVWGFNACRHMSSLVPDNPDKVWNTVTSSFKKARDKYS